MGYLIGGPTTYITNDTTEGKTFGLGDLATDSSGAQYRYVKAGAAITAYDTVWIDETYTANPITRALAATTGQVGVAQQAFTGTDYYGFVAVAGGAVTLRVAASSSADATLWTSDTAGVLTSTAATATHFPVMGFVAASAGSAGGVTNVAGFIAYPVIQKPVGF